MDLAVAALVLATLFASRATPPAAASGVFTGNSFDTCSAPSLATMSAWRQNSPYSSMNIYIGGAAAACGTGNLSADYVAVLQSQGWHLIPTYVGLQAPCAGQAGLNAIDPNAAAAQGSVSADDAVAQAARFGLPPGTPIYFDMEAYGRDPACVGAVVTFLSAWTAELHNRGYLSGVYGSSCSTIADEAAVYNDRTYSRPDNIWFARWNTPPSASLIGDACFSDAFWSDHQRIRQFQGGHLETYGGVQLNIDSDYSDATQSPAGSAGWSQLQAVPSGQASPAQGGPAAASWGRGRLDVFWTGVNRSVFHQWSVACGSCQESLGSPPGGATSAPAAVAWAVDRLDVFVRGSDFALWHTWYGGTGWHGWERLGGGLSSAPAVASWNAGRLDVFVVGQGNQMYHMYFSAAGWSQFESLGGFCYGDPGAVSWGVGRIDLFTIGGGGRMFHQYWDVGWHGWLQETGGEAWVASPAAASWSAGRLDVFSPTAASGNPLSHLYWSNSWGFEQLAERPSAPPAAVSSGWQELDVIVRGVDGALYHRSYGR